MKKCGLILIGILIFSCSVKTALLKDNTTVIPAKNTIFKNKLYFDPSVLKGIDTNALYVEQYYYASAKNSFEQIGSEHYQTDSYLGCYKFYGNGCLNLFVMSEDQYKHLKPSDLDPEKYGQRGIFYQKERTLGIDLFTIIGYGFTPDYGLKTFILQVKDERLYEKSLSSLENVQTYLKRTLPKEFLVYKAEW